MKVVYSVFKLKLKYKVDKVGEKHDWWVLSFRIISLVYSRKTQEKPKRKPRKPQEKSKGISSILKALQYADYHNSSVYLFCLTREFPVVFPPYITMVWYLFLVKGSIIQVLWLFCMVRWSLRPSLWWLRCCSGRISGSCGWVVWLCEVKQSTLTCEMPDFTGERF